MIKTSVYFYSRMIIWNTMHSAYKKLFKCFTLMNRE